MRVLSRSVRRRALALSAVIATTVGLLGGTASALTIPVDGTVEGTANVHIVAGEAPLPPYYLHVDTEFTVSGGPLDGGVLHEAYDADTSGNLLGGGAVSLELPGGTTYTGYVGSSAATGCSAPCGAVGGILGSSRTIVLDERDGKRFGSATMGHLALELTGTFRDNGSGSSGYPFAFALDSSGTLSGELGDGSEPLPIRNLRVLDGEGNPFTGPSGVIYCVAPSECEYALADGQGVVDSFDVAPAADYEVRAFTLDTGWSCPSSIPGFPGEFHFSETADLRGWDLAAPRTFVVSQSCFEFTILDDHGNPFPAGSAGLIVCPEAAGCSAPLFGGADENGVVRMTNLDPSVSYVVNAFATTAGGSWAGWDCGYWENPQDGSRFWFSDFSTGTPASIDGTTFVIAEPTCYDFQVVVHLLDGTQTALPQGHGHVQACTGPGACAIGNVDATGHATLGLDPSTTYAFQGAATNMTGWTCPDYVDGNGNQFWWSTEYLVTTPGPIDGTTFHVFQPDPSGCGAP